MKPSLFISVVAFVFSASANAAVYKCEENGQTIFSDRPCGQAAEKVEIKNEKKRASSSTSKWEVLRAEDEMTGRTTCVAKSPNIYMGKEGSNFLFASLRVVTLNSGFVVGARSEVGFDSRPASIHNDISGLGVKVGDFGFQEFDVKQGSYVVGFDPDTSARIVEELKQSEHFRVRLRYWPYQETYDSSETTTQGLADALEDLRACDQDG